MPAPEDAAARLVARLLADPAYRAAFRRDPPGVARAAGLPALADALAERPRGLQRLEVRESRSVLAGAAAAVLAEGLAAAQHGVEASAGPPAEAAGPLPVVPPADPAGLYRRGEFPAVREDQVVGDPARFVGKEPEPAPVPPPDVPAGPPGAGLPSEAPTLGGGEPPGAVSGTAATLGRIEAVPGAGTYAVAEAAAEAGASGLGGAAAAEAARHLGTPYVWGGATPAGFDCSGLVKFVYGRLGVEVPRVAAQQALAGLPVTSPALLAPGDLVYFDEGDGYVEHIGIYLGGGRFVHAPQRGDVVKVSSLEDAYYSRAYLGARRVAPGGPGIEASSGGTFGSLSAAPQADGAARSTLGGVAPQAAAAGLREMLAGAAPLDPALFPYPGEAAGPEAVARWMAAAAAARGLPPELPVITSMAESGLRNLPYGDRDSLGLFQQRPSQGWGSPAQVMDPYHALGTFLHRAALADEGGRFSAGGVEGLGVWAQAVQRSAFPERYQPRLEEARTLIAG